MISVENAQEIILGSISSIPAEEVAFLSSLNRVLAEDIYAEEDIPPFMNAAMDGYAVKAEDIFEGVTLKVIDEIPAGRLPQRELLPGMAVQIMTGAPLPANADSVVMLEYTERNGETITINRKKVQSGENVRKKGEDVVAGELVIAAGELIRPPEFAMLAALGEKTVLVSRRPKVAVISTGDEIVDINQPLEYGKIRNVNSYSLISQISEAGAIPINLGIAKDIKEDIRRLVKQGIEEADFLISSGGVSIGTYDLVKDVLIEMGLQLKFWGVAMKPGKPSVFGLINQKLFFGLPGYPVSSMITFELLVRPAILKSMGTHKLFRPRIKAIVLDKIVKKPDRIEFIRVKLLWEKDRYVAKLSGSQQSGVLKSMLNANGLLIAPQGVSLIDEGEEVDVYLLYAEF